MPRIMPRSPGSCATGDEATSGVMVKESSAISLHYPMLTMSNYAVCAIKMKVYMRAQGVWDAVEDDNIGGTQDELRVAKVKVLCWY